MTDRMLPDDWMAQIKSVYPNRRGEQGWAKLRTIIPRRIAEGHDFETMLKGAANYRRHCEQKGDIGGEFVKRAETFFGPGLYFEEWAEMDLRTPHQIAQDAKWADLEGRARAMGFNTVDRSRGYEVALRAVEQVERENERKMLERTGLKLRVVG